MLDSKYQPILQPPSAFGALSHPRSPAIGIALLSGFAGATALLGVAYLVLAVTVILLPTDTEYLGIGISQLCAIDDCRLVDFLTHGRMSYGGVLVAVGVMSGWLTGGPLRRREAWAWWALLFAGVATYGSFLTFLAYGYLEPWHAAFVCIVSAIGITGLILTRPHLGDKRGLVDAFRAPAANGWLSSPRGRGRLIVGALAMGIGAGGISILVIASSVVFVPQDTAFIGLDSAGISTLSERLVPIMAHDRAGFGGGMVAIAILFAATAWRGLRLGEAGAWPALAVSGLIYYVPTLVVHIAIDYTSLVHLLPVYGGLAALFTALLMLWTPLHRGSHEPHQFADT
jgi:hypothetical protein